MNDKWVLVTGGAVRLGRAFSLAFARAGWHVACHYGQSAVAAEQLCADVRALGQQALMVQAELARPEEVKQAFAQAVHGMGGKAPDAIVNSASSFEPDEGLDFSLSNLERQLQVNLTAPLYWASLLAQQLRAERQQATHAARQRLPGVVHVLDQKVLNLNPDYFSYTVSKLALERAVALQAQALAPHVRINGLAPGLVLPSGAQGEAEFAQTGAVNALQKYTPLHDVAETAVFLASNQSITGAVLAVDSGQHLVPTANDIMFVQEQLQKAQRQPAQNSHQNCTPLAQPSAANQKGAS